MQAVGRTPNGKKIVADQAGVAITSRGFINVNIQMRTNVPPEFDSSRHFRKVGFNEINNLEAIFTFSCGGTF